MEQEQKDNTIVVIGVDLYNQCLTGNVSRSLTNSNGGDAKPVVIIYKQEDNYGK